MQQKSRQDVGGATPSSKKNETGGNKTMTRKELQDVIKSHERWLNGGDGERADLSDANLSGANLSGANLCYAILSNADLSDIIFNEGTAFYALQCPEEGSFIGYKKAHGYIVKLEILADAKRSSATSRKCRCSAAKVLSITAVDESEEVKEIASDKDSNFIYRVGEIVRVNNFDENRWNECSTGIHFFITRREAEQYGA